MSVGHVIGQALDLISYIANTKSYDQKLARCMAKSLVDRFGKYFTPHYCPDCGHPSSGLTIGLWWCCIECGYEAPVAACENQDLVSGFY